MASTEMVQYNDIENALINMAESQALTSEEVQQDIVRRILASKTLEEAAQSFEATSAEDVEGVVLTVHGVAWLRSSYKEGPPVFCLIDCTPDGAKARIKVSLGGRSAMAVLLWAQHHKAMPFNCVLSRSEPGGENGYRYWRVYIRPDSAK